MIALNEDGGHAGRLEIGDRAYEAMTGIKFDRQPPAPHADPDPNAFDFNAHMRETRQHTEKLLEEGRIAEAESYMEERRLELLERGYRIRKINQAFFAFYGSYATSAASVSQSRASFEDCGIAASHWETSSTPSPNFRLTKSFWST